jgi:hypothetical protein
LLGDWWIIVSSAAADPPRCFIMTPAEVRSRAVQDQNKDRARWLPPKQYQSEEFRERWDRIGSPTIHGKVEADTA